MTKDSIIVRGKNDEIIIRGENAGSNIKLLRQYMNKTQEKLANDTFINVKRLREIENNGLSPTIDEMMKICKVLEVSVLALFFNAKINEITCDYRTGLNTNAIQWLKELNYNNHDFIKIINYLSVKPKLFKFVYDVIKPIIINLKNLS